MFEYYYLNNKDYKFYITDEIKKITEHTFLDNSILWENKEIEYFYKNVDRNNNINILDIGAQSGLYTLFAKFLPNATFYSFEPFKLTYDLLCDNIKLNNINNVKTYNIGLSNKKEIAIFNTCISHNGLHTFGKNVLRFNDIKQIEIETDTIDNLFYNNNIPVDYIKIDTEGYEYYILKGGEKTIKKYKPYIQLEYNNVNIEQCNINPIDLDKLIEELEYVVINKESEEMTIVHKSRINEYN